MALFVNILCWPILLRRRLLFITIMTDPIAIITIWPRDGQWVVKTKCVAEGLKLNEPSEIPTEDVVPNTRSIIIIFKP